jgi:tRNA(adenine34) deaminase
VNEDVNASDTPMHVALRMARRAYRMGEVPVGAVIVYQGDVVAAAHNAVEKGQSSLAHAEMLAIVMAQRRMRSKYLDQCYLYVTLQPCSMCAHAIALARLKRVYFGAYASGAGSLPYPEWVGGISETACHDLLSTFFAEKR